MSQTSWELEKILKETSVENIHSLQFFPNNEESFSIKNENIIKMSVYISEKLQKTEFWPAELENAFHFLINNFHTNLPENEYRNLTEKLNLFIKNGGKIEIIKQTLLGSLWIDTLSEPPHKESMENDFTEVIQTERYQNRSLDEKVITFPRILFTIFLIEPIVWALGMLLFTFFKWIGVTSSYYPTSMYSLIGMILLSANVFIIKRKFNLSIWNAILLYIVSNLIIGLIFIWGFLIICWGLLFSFGH